MTTYLIGRVTVRDAEKLKAYQALVPAIVAQYGGVFLARGGATGTLEGPEENRRMVIMAFASGQAAEAAALALHFLQSPDRYGFHPRTLTRKRWD